MLDGNNQLCAYEITAGNTKIEEKNGSCDDSVNNSKTAKESLH